MDWAAGVGPASPEKLTPFRYYFGRHTATSSRISLSEPTPFAILLSGHTLAPAAVTTGQLASDGNNNGPVRRHNHLLSLPYHATGWAVKIKNHFLGLSGIRDGISIYEH